MTFSVPSPSSRPLLDFAGLCGSTQEFGVYEKREKVDHNS